jgi:urease accessory protein
VSGDELRISIDLHEGSKVLITTPGAGRVYRARADKRLQQQKNFLKLAPHTSLEWFPAETIVFPGAHTQLNTHVDLSPGSRFLGWEITSLGLPSCGIEFDEGELCQRLLISCEQRPLLTESLIINEASREILNSIVGMRGNPVNGIFIAGPVSKAQSNDCERILLEIRALPQSGSNPYLSGVSIVGDFIVARYLGDCTEQAKHYFTGLWQILRPFILERKICKPRIWAT